MGASGKSANSVSSGSAVVTGQSSSTGGPGQQMPRNGLNPALRGYSPSKPFWKQGGPSPVTAGKTATSGQKTQLYSNSIGGGSSSLVGGQNPNIYTRSTKHTPSYKWGVVDWAKGGLTENQKRKACNIVRCKLILYLLLSYAKTDL
jgi:hypothetical protein